MRAFLFSLLMLLASLVVYATFAFSLAQIGIWVLKNVYSLDGRLLQEKISFALSAAMQAPDRFYLAINLKGVPHEIRINKDPPNVEVKVHKPPYLPTEIELRQPEPVSYVKFKGVELSGDCIARWCKLSENLTIMEIEKSGNTIVVHFIRR